MKYERQPSPKPLTMAEVSQNARELLLKQGSHYPVILVDGTQRILPLVIEEFAPTFEGRRQQLFTAGFQTAFQVPLGTLRQVFLISEAWMTTTSKEDYPPALTPSQDPKRKEVLIISQLVVSSKSEAVEVWEMRRDKKEKLVDIVLLTDMHEYKAHNTPLVEAFVTGYQMAKARLT